MQEYTNSQEALAAVEQSKTFVIATLNDFDEVAHKNVHNCYELFYAQSSGGKLLIDNRNYLVERGSMFFINDFESHFFTAEKTNMYQRKVMYIHPPFLRSLSTPQTDLTQCFQRENREKFGHKVLLSKSQQSLVNQLLQRLANTSEGYGQDIMEQSVFCELMVQLNQFFVQAMEEGQQPAASNETSLVDDIIKYINENITDRLQISIIAAHFTSAMPMSAGHSKPRPAPPSINTLLLGALPLPSSTWPRAAPCSTPVRRVVFGITPTL